MKSSTLENGMNAKAKIFVERTPADSTKLKINNLINLIVSLILDY